jgi:uncharacterized protein with FMN-binding domain
VNDSIRTTKKVLLTAGVIVVFFAYTFLLRNQHSGPVIAPSATKASDNTSSSTGTSSGGSGSGSGSGTNTASASYKDGSYTGSVANAYYGNVQVQVSISGGKITNVQFLQYPNDNPNSQNINQQATPYLQQEAIQAQSANVNTITGATFTSQAFVQSLSSALNQAKA